jgi:cytochrome oxidase Cu insertion factor (SCO1/SenC/PrrC family)
MRWIVTVLTLAAAFAGPQSGGAPRSLDALGPQVGQRVPDFALRDQNGTSHSLESVRGPKGAMIVFFRSADW